MIVGLDSEVASNGKSWALIKRALTFDLDPLLLFFVMLSVTYVLRKFIYFDLKFSL